MVWAWAYDNCAFCFSCLRRLYLSERVGVVAGAIQQKCGNRGCAFGVLSIRSWDDCFGRGEYLQQWDAGVIGRGNGGGVDRCDGDINGGSGESGDQAFG